MKFNRYIYTLLFSFLFFAIPQYGSLKIGKEGFETEIDKDMYDPGIYINTGDIDISKLIDVDTTTCDYDITQKCGPNTENCNISIGPCKVQTSSKTVTKNITQEKTVPQPIIDQPVIKKIKK